MASTASEIPKDDARLVLYDGVCGFCDGMVRWLLVRDAGRLLYAPLQSRTAAQLRLRHPQIPEELDTMAYVESRAGQERVWLHSDAACRVFAQLGWPWRGLAWLRWLPRSLRDAAYRAFARRRYRLFGRLESCRVPEPALRARFLD